MPITFDEIAKSDYILLTTFTRDGRAKPTPIWAAPDTGGDGLLVITQEQAWKVKRIRNTARVTIAKCDARGNVKSDAVEATATILDKSRTGEVYDALSKRYGLLGRAFNFFSKLRGGMTKNVGLLIAPVGT